MATVYVVTTFTPSTGGFEWFATEENALAFYKSEIFAMRKFARGEYLPLYIGGVEVPADVKRGEVTEWLDARSELWDCPTCKEET